ncbi:MAG: sulfur carrier protein ThiS [Acidobacteria bacterium]|nr:sulfur carrier protein ThiS [Acidobacteriota bacterium]
MNITVNGKDVTLDGGDLSVREFLAAMKFRFPMIVVKVNGQVVRKDAWDSARIHDGDRVEAIHLMGGG